MYINKIYFHASLAFGALVLSAIFDDETGENGRLAIARYIFAALLVAYLAGMGLVYTLAQSAPAAGDDKTITYKAPPRDECIDIRVYLGITDPILAEKAKLEEE